MERRTSLRQRTKPVQYVEVEPDDDEMEMKDVGDEDSTERKDDDVEQLKDYEDEEDDFEQDDLPPSEVEEEDEEEFLVTPPEEKKKKRKRAASSSAKKKKAAAVNSESTVPESASKPTSSAKKTNKRRKKTDDTNGTGAGAIDIIEISPSPTTPATSASTTTSSSKKPTAAQRRKSGLHSPAIPPSAEQIARDEAFRAFATAPVASSSKSRPTTSSTSSSIPIALSDDDEIMEISPFVPSNKKDKPSTAASSSTTAAAAWGQIGLNDSSTTSSSKSHTLSNSTKAKPVTSRGKSSTRNASDQEVLINTVQELLGHSSSVKRSNIIRYLENANWKVDLAVDRILESGWFQSSLGGGGASASASVSSTAATPVPSRPKPSTTTPSAAPSASNRSTASFRASAAAAAAAAAAATPTAYSTHSATPSAASPTTSTKKPPPPFTINDDSTIQDDLMSDPFNSTPNFSLAPLPKLIKPNWERKLLLVLNVSALSTTSGRGILQAGDIIDFVREPFDPQGWEESERERELAANGGPGTAASNTPKKKPPPKKNAVVAKKPARILRFKKRGAQANSLEIGSVPPILTQILAPLFDSHFVDIDSSVLYVPAVLDYYTTITLSVTVYVHSTLFTYQPPSGSATQLPLNKQSENPFWKKIFAKKDAAAGLASSQHRWNPIEAFCTLLKECEVQPIASTEMELDEAVQKVAKTLPPIPMTTEEKKDANDATSGASSSSNAAPVEPVYEEEAEAAKGADSASSDATATISRFQLDSLYASAGAISSAIPEADPPPQLKTTLRPYQLQALYWMKQRENDSPTDLLSSTATDSTEAKPASTAAPRRHALWDEYAFADAVETRFYVNMFTNEISLAFPASTGSAKGGILADEMGMGKTVQAIALILANHPSNLILDLKENEEVKEEELRASQGEKMEAEEDGDVEMIDGEERKEAPAAAAASSSSKKAPPITAATSSSFFDLNTTRLKHRKKYMFHNGVSGCTLIIVPMSLLSQWRDEIARFSSMECLVYYGSTKDRKKVNFTDYDIILTSYGVVTSEHRSVVSAQSSADAAALAQGAPRRPLSASVLATLSPIFSTTFWRIVLDEAHIIRNRSTETSKAVCHLRGERRWALSGTIIQNKIDDVFAPLLFLREEPWSSYGWWTKVISQPFEKQDPIALQRLRAILTPLMLRRTKAMKTASGESIVDLPPRLDQTYECVFSEEERDFYQALFNRSRAQFEGFVSSGVVSSKYIQILTLLLRLRQTCDHPYLVLGASQKSDREFESDVNRFIQRFVSRVDLRSENAPSIQFLETIANDLKQKARQVTSASASSTTPVIEDKQECSICLELPTIPVLTECAHLFCRECLNPLFNDRGLARCPLCRAIIDRTKLFLVPEIEPAVKIDAAKQWKHSSKTKRLLEELHAIRTGDDPTAKIIIFSQWTSMLNLLEIPLKQDGFHFLRLDGSLSQKEREGVLKQFGRPVTSSSDPTILLISLKAGGVGLNLVMANYCFFIDCWWNPSVEEQACQRVHRIGQTKTVYVKRFIVQGTIEERILELQEKKKFLAQSVAVDQEEQKQVRMQDLVDLFKA